MSDDNALMLIDAETGERILPSQDAWREHTAERWKRDWPEQYDECVAAIKAGHTNISQLAARFPNPRTGKPRSRQSVAALLHAEFSVEQFKSITALKAAVVTAQSLDRQSEVIERAGAKELGALSMAGKAGMEIAQVLTGGPTEIKESRHLTMDVDTYKAWLEAQETGSQAGKKSAMPPEAEATAAAESLSNNETPKNASIAQLKPVIDVLLMILSPFLQELLCGFLNRGGGG